MTVYCIILAVMLYINAKFCDDFYTKKRRRKNKKYLQKKKDFSL